MRFTRIALVTGAALAVLVSLYAATLIWTNTPEPRGLVASNGTAAIGGPFSMVDDRGERVSEADLVGKPTALFFGFTYCPDVCPTTLFELAGLMRELGPDADEMNFVLVTVDPERDTPEILHEYVQAFDPRFRAFTGTAEEVAWIAEAYKVQYRRVETPSGYTMDHTSSVYLMNRENGFSGTITAHESPETALAKLRRLIEAS